MKIAIGLVLLILSRVDNSCGLCSSDEEYENNLCAYTPAPPGRAPLCAKSGVTYCEHPVRYPRQLIHFLIDKGQFNFTTLLTNESPDEFHSYFIPSKHSYGYGASNSLNQDNHYLPPKYSPPDTYLTSFEGIHRNKTDFEGYTYKQPSQGYSSRNRNDNYKQNYRSLEPSYSRIVKNNNNFKPSQYIPNDRRKRQVEQLTNLEKRRKERRVVRTLLNTNSYGKWHMRKKRQSALTGQPLCETRTRYVMPRAAVNQRGNWMYIVNMPEVDNKYMQLVRSEICVSQQCNGLCQLPLGYSSRCEQKYLQRRLIALEESGSQLYSDIFWFPTCCVCTVAN